MVIFFIVAQSSNAQNYNKSPEFLKSNSFLAISAKLGLNINDPRNYKIATEITGNEGAASVADPQTGEIPFYSNGGTVWNKNNLMMLMAIVYWVMEQPNIQRRKA